VREYRPGGDFFLLPCSGNGMADRCPVVKEVNRRADANMWREVTMPLSDGWYRWRCGPQDPDPECLQVCNGVIMDIRPKDSWGTDWERYEHRDFSGQWSGPIDFDCLEPESTKCSSDGPSG